MKLCEFLKIEAGTMQIDWENVEKHMGFAIHKDLKDFYSRNTGKNIEGTVNFVQKKFIEKTGNKRNDTWFSFNRCEGTVHYKLNLLSAKHKTFADAVDYVFSVWTGGNDFGHRAFLGTLSVKMGEITILFNNDTGKIEWVDFGYGYFDVYEENPNGILANSMQEFFNKLSDEMPKK